MATAGVSRGKISDMPDSFRLLRRLKLRWVLLAAFLLRLGTFHSQPIETGERFYHFETDENVFRTLVAKVRENPADYTLRGTTILRNLKNEIYDRPLFFHPPLFVYVAALLQSAGLPFELVPVFFSLGTLLCAYWLGLILYDERRAVLGTLLAALCPVTWFISQKFWIDNALIFTWTLCLAVQARALRKKTASAFALAGIAFGLAMNSKITGLALLPALVYSMAREPVRSPRAWLAFATAAIAVAAPWLLASLHFNGSMIPDLRWNPASRSYWGFVDQAMSRPWYFHWLQLSWLTPIAFTGFFVSGASSGRKGVSRAYRAETMILLASACLLIGLTAIGHSTGYQTRFAAPVLPGLLVIAAERIHRPARAPARALQAVLILWGAALGVYYGVLNSQTQAELFQPVWKILSMR